MLLYHRTWLPDTAPRALVVVAHGYAEHGERYAPLAERLTAAGYAVRAPDHRGHGRSGGARTNVTRFDDYVEDLHALMRLPSPGAGKPVLLGHSLGGLIALRYALQHEDEIHALVLSAPAACPGEVSHVTVRVGRLLSRVAPSAGVIKLPLEKISRDPAVVAAYRADPLVFATKLRARLGAEMLDAMKSAQRDLPRLRCPLLVMQGTEDGLVDPSCGPLVHQLAGSSDKTLRTYPGLWHEIFNEPERDQVISDLVTWLDARA